MSGTIGVQWRHSKGAAHAAASRGLRPFIAVLLALTLTVSIVAVTAIVVERLG